MGEAVFALAKEATEAAVFLWNMNLCYCPLGKRKKKNWCQWNEIVSKKDSLPAFHQSLRSHQRGFWRDSFFVPQHCWAAGGGEPLLCAAGTWTRWRVQPDPEPPMRCAPKLLHRTDRGKQGFLWTWQQWAGTLNYILLNRDTFNGNKKYGCNWKKNIILKDEMKEKRHACKTELRVSSCNLSCRLQLSLCSDLISWTSGGAETRLLSSGWWL